MSAPFPDAGSSKGSAESSARLFQRAFVERLAAACALDGLPQAERKGHSYQVGGSSGPVFGVEGDDGRFRALDRLGLWRGGPAPLGGAGLTGTVRPRSDSLPPDGIRLAVGVLVAGPGPADFQDPVRLAGNLTRLAEVVLVPVRFLYTLATAELGSTDEAVHYYLAQPSAVAAELVSAATRARHGQPDSPERLTELLHTELIPLYLHFIDRCHRGLSPSNSDPDLDLAHWRARLMAHEGPWSAH